MSLDGGNYEITSANMVYATQVIDSGSEFSRTGEYDRWTYEPEIKEKLTDPVPSVLRGNAQTSRVQCGEPSKPPEREIIDERIKRSQSAQPSYSKDRNVVRSQSERPPCCEKPTVARTASVDASSHLKASTTSLANLASDIVVVSTGWFSSLRRPGKKKRKQQTNAAAKARSAWDLSNLGKMVRSASRGAR